VGELVGLHAHQADQAASAGPLEVGDDAIRPHTGVGLVERLDNDVDVRTQHLPMAAVLAQAVEGGQRVGRDVRAQPGDRIAVVVVVRRLDQHQLEGGSLGCPAHYGLSPL
jgi:hypothetical protein